MATQNRISLHDSKEVKVSQQLFQEILSHEMLLRGNHVSKKFFFLQKANQQFLDLFFSHFQQPKEK